MFRPIIFVHEYSANSAAFDLLRDALHEECAWREFHLDPEALNQAGRVLQFL